MVWRGRFSIRDGRSAASSIQGYEPAGPILDYALKPQIMAPGYLPEAFAINDSCKADGRKRRGPEQLSFIHQGEIARALSYLLARKAPADGHRAFYEKPLIFERQEKARVIAGIRRACRCLNVGRQSLTTGLQRIQRFSSGRRRRG